MFPGSLLDHPPEATAAGFVASREGGSWATLGEQEASTIRWLQRDPKDDGGGRERGRGAAFGGEDEDDEEDEDTGRDELNSRSRDAAELKGAALRLGFRSSLTAD